MQTNNAEVEEKMKDLTECSICIETYKDPRVLPCIHTFCKKCLEEIGNTMLKSPGEQMPCPICRKGFTIPVDGFAGVQKNFFVERLIDLRKTLNPFSDSVPCDVCLDSIDPSVAVEPSSASMFCVDCQQRMCMECCTGHKKYKMLKNHRLKSLDEDLTKSVLPPKLCEHHEKNIQLFCTNCMEAVCVACFFEHHKMHEGSTIDSIVGSFHDQILEHIKSLSSIRVDLEQKGIELEENRLVFLKNMEGLESDINKRRLELKELVDKDADSLISDVNRLKHERMKDNEAKKDDIEVLLTSVDSFKMYCQQITSKGSADDICRSIHNLNIRAEELKQNYLELENLLSQMKNLSLKKTQLQEFLIQNSNGNIIGEITDEAKKNPEHDGLLLPTITSLISESDELQARKQIGDKIKDLNKQLAFFKDVNIIGSASTKPKGRIDYSKQPSYLSSIPVEEDDDEEECKALAVLGNELFVAFESGVVEVYGLSSLQFKRRWKLGNLTKAYDMTQCKKNECIYVCGVKLPGQRGIHVKTYEVIRFDPKGTKINAWEVASRGQMSATSEGNVLIISVHQESDEEDEIERSVHEYAPDGNLIRTIPLTWNAGIENPWHAIELSSGFFLVGHGYGHDRLHGVCLMDDAGDVITDVGRKLFNSPTYLHLDSCGNVLVANLDSSRTSSRLACDPCHIVALSPDLEVVQQYVLKEMDYNPNKLNIDEVNGRLFVLVDESRILIYEFQML